ncbi:CLUMA_CG014137, isoform A [Clunio marinus]|uniref:CLUMA_CG014137, isoform A n=1 Tax=Clunio marinus TaxID=568069 RepID=A0A1J1IP85_9DIPT|nr:CLUMA_CG014137, isoform A [Clunio marinus]
MTEQISEKQMKKFKVAFSVFDKNDDGIITIEELGNVMELLGQKPSKTAMLSMIREADVNGNGVIDFPEFVTLMLERIKNPDSDLEIHELFCAIDKDSNGLISALELQQMLTGFVGDLKDEEFNEIFRDTDIDNDGYIDYDEFMKMMKSLENEQQEKDLEEENEEQKFEEEIEVQTDFVIVMEKLENEKQVEVKKEKMKIQKEEEESEEQSKKEEEEENVK